MEGEGREEGEERERGGREKGKERKEGREGGGAVREGEKLSNSAF